jgi:hypothetical protein
LFWNDRILNMSETALHEVVFDYVSKIPDTIQKDILIFVVVYACRKIVAAGDDFVEIVRGFLLEQDSEMATFGAFFVQLRLWTM